MSVGQAPGDVHGIRFTVHGKPRPKGSMKAVGPRGRGGMKEDNDESGPWRSAVGWAALRAIGELERSTTERWVPLDGPVEVVVVFSFAKPASAPKTRETFPITRSTYDTDKLQRNVGDALSDAGVVTDDARIVRWVAQKTYCGVPPSQLQVPGAEIDVHPYTRGTTT